jgi:hypothetical protein
MKRWLPLAVLAIAVVAMLAHGPIPQLERYHEFADTRSLLGIPNAADVLSNVGFAVVGLWGLVALRARGYLLFAFALVLTAIGSSYYHWAPDNQRLVWDRIPIALACAGLLAAVHAETHDPAQPPWIPIALVVAAIASVLWWSFTEERGAGDLRPYLLLQGAPLVLIPLWQHFARSPRASRISFGVAILLYAIAKAAESGDRAIFDALGFVSGHTLKHLLAALAGAVIVGGVLKAVHGPGGHGVH